MTEKELQAILNGMTTEEKILQLTQMPYAYLKSDGGEITGPVKEMGFNNADVSRLGTILNARSTSAVSDLFENYQLKNGAKVPIAIPNPTFARTL